MLTAVCIVVSIICAIGWGIKHISTLALIHFIQTKGYNLPTDDEMKECSNFVVRKMFRLD